MLEEVVIGKKSVNSTDYRVDQAGISDNTFLPITFRLSCGRRKNDRLIEIFQIGKRGLQDQLVLCVLCDCRFQVSGKY